MGKWVNAKGYSIEFYSDGTGFVPGTDGQMPVSAATFNYSFTDDSHILISIPGLKGTVVEIKIEGDQMTWLNPDAGLAFVYTRSK